jgi:rSAM/selenodomain-associated transferase 1
VKTRLVPVLGAEGAAALHARLVKRALATARLAARHALELHADPVEDDFLRLCAASYGATLVPQCGSELGERMQRAFERALSQQNCAAAVLIGSDCPALTPWHIRTALEALQDGNDAVLAPAQDGGYVLLGLARSDPLLFDGIAWGTGQVLDQTRARLRTLGWRWLELETLWDVDRPADWERLNASKMLDDPVRVTRTS